MKGAGSGSESVRMDDARSNSAVPGQRKRLKMLPDPESNSLQMR